MAATREPKRPAHVTPLPSRAGRFSMSKRTVSPPILFAICPRAAAPSGEPTPWRAAAKASLERRHRRHDFPHLLTTCFYPLTAHEHVGVRSSARVGGQGGRTRDRGHAQR